MNVGKTYAATMAKRRLLEAALATQAGRMLSVQFIKKDGSVRDMLIQAGRNLCKPDATEEGRARAAKRRENHPNLIPVYDHKAKGVRSINLDTTQRVKVDGLVIELA